MNIQNMVKYVTKLFKLQQHPIEWIQFLEFVQKEQPKIIIEIGIGSGASTLCLSYFTKHIIGIDSVIPKNKNVIFQKIRKNCKFDFLQYNTCDPKCVRKAIRALGGQKADLLFIDGEHTYQGARRDFKKFSRLVKDGGIIALHDITSSSAHRKLNCKVYRFWNSIKNKYKSTEISLSKKWAGIGIIKFKKI